MVDNVGGLETSVQTLLIRLFINITHIIFKSIHYLELLNFRLRSSSYIYTKCSVISNLQDKVERTESYVSNVFCQTNMCSNSNLLKMSVKVATKYTIVLILIFLVTSASAYIMNDETDIISTSITRNVSTDHSLLDPQSEIDNEYICVCFDLVKFKCVYLFPNGSIYLKRNFMENDDCIYVNETILIYVSVLKPEKPPIPDHKMEILLWLTVLCYLVSFAFIDLILHRE